MLGIDRRAARAAWTVFLVALAVLIVYTIAHTLLLFILAILFAYLLSPVVSFAQRFFHKRYARLLALLTVYVLLVGILVLFGILIGGKVVEQSTTLVNSLPTLLENTRKQLEQPGPAWFHPIRQYLKDALESNRLQALAGELVPVLKTIGERALSLAGSLSIFVLIPILAFFFLKDAGELKENVLKRLVSTERRVLLDDILQDVHQLLGHFIRSLVILSTATFAVYSIFLSVMGVPYGILLAVLAAAGEFIPVVGPITASIAILLVAGLGGGGHILVILIFLAVYRLFQDYVLSPQLMSSGIELHPLLVIFGVLAGEEIAGIPGMFLSIPVMATLRVAYTRMRKQQLAVPPAATL